MTTMTTTHTTPTEGQLAFIDTLTQGMTFEQLAEAHSVLDLAHPEDHESFTEADASRLIDHLLDRAAVIA